MAREVLVPVLLDKLEELEVVLHLAFHEGFDGDRLVNLVLGKGICKCDKDVVRWVPDSRGINLCRSTLGVIFVPSRRA